jgi:hypothetical protein
MLRPLHFAASLNTDLRTLITSASSVQPLKGRESLVVFAADISYGHDVFKMLGRETRYNSL